MIFDAENKVKLIVPISLNRYSKEESTFVPQNYKKTVYDMIFLHKAISKLVF